ncbi:zinc-binding dehydrogenase [Microbacterium pygmaeum]|uniref:zinc-binding dehydrogenase n=1 Tax=Microbacterium pygmaeum TaxID=370764 RepID=UPI000AE9ED42|nr:zinc-binding dehydrogenase [Microbacterium pygmaeum]
MTVLIDNFGQDGRGLAAELGVLDSRHRSSIDRCETELKLLRADEDSVARATQLLARVTSLAKMRAFTLLISGLYRLDDVAEAYRDLEQMHARGKVVLGTHLVNSMRVRKARDVHEAAR